MLLINRRHLVGFVVFLTALSMGGQEVARAQSAPHPEYIMETHHDASPPLSKIAPRAVLQNPGGTISLQDYQAQVQSAAGGLTTGQITNTGTTAGLSFDSVSATSKEAYGSPDPNAAVGATQVVDWANARFAVYSKSTGALEYGPVSANTLWNGFGGPCQNTDLADGVIEYDKIASRWIITHHAAVTGGPYYQCVAVSKTSDATGGWYRYSFQVSTYFNDYVKISVWPDAYYTSANLLDQNNGYNFVGALSCALDRNSMLTGAPASMVCFTINTGTYCASMLPSDLDGSTPPPAGSPNYYMSLGLGMNELMLYQFHVDFVTPSNSTFVGPTVIPVTKFSGACQFSNYTCIPQKTSKQLLFSLGDRLMFRLAYRNFGSYESIVATHAIIPSGAAKSGIRWYEIRSPGSNPVIYQSGTFSPDSTDRFMPSISMDQLGDLAVGYSTSSTTQNPGIAYTGRLVTDPPGTLQSETVVLVGNGSQSQPDPHWGDYTSMGIDPVDDCTFWYANQYLKANGTYNWTTHLVSFKFPSCP